MFLGGMLFLSGFIGILVLVCISVFKPWVYNGVQGLKGFLLGSDTMLFFVTYCVISIIGIVLCLLEAYGKNKN